jgi:hypothetical protein
MAMQAASAHREVATRLTTAASATNDSYSVRTTKERPRARNYLYELDELRQDEQYTYWYFYPRV